MTKFYKNLSTSPIKSEGLRQAQIEMLRHQKRQQLGFLLDDLKQQGINVPDLLEALEEKEFSHPYFWAGFTVVGNPW
jgi:CHAT domain-containing protein